MGRRLGLAQEASFCAVCHTPMKSYVDGYKGGDDTLMITPHATGETILHRGDKTLTTTTPPATGKDRSQLSRLSRAKDQTGDYRSFSLDDRQLRVSANSES